MTRYTVENTLAVLCFDEVFCYDSEQHEAITHIPLLWGANRGVKPQLHLQICYGPSHAALFHCALTVPPPHENTRTEFCQNLGSKTPQNKAVIAVSEQRKSITEKCLAVGWGFLVRARYSCHPASGDSYMLAKICLEKKQNLNIRTTANDWEFFSTGLHSLKNSENVKFRAGDSIHNTTLRNCLTTWNACVWSWVSKIPNSKEDELVAGGMALKFTNRYPVAFP